MSARLKLAALLVPLALLLLPPPDAAAQLGGLRDAARRATERVAGDGLASKLTGDPPISTSLSDAVYADPELDDFDPAAEEFVSMTTLPRTDTGGFTLAEGLYEMHTQSYCLKAGTHGPGGGDGYLFAPPVGAAEAVVTAILRNSVNHPEIPQRDIQVLLWSIIARAKFEDWDNRIRATALRLVDEQMLLMVNRSALDFVPASVMNEIVADMPPLVRQIVEAENSLRRMVTETDATFAEMERVAVLAGMAEMGPGSRDVPSGRWSLHPDGYYVRYLPQGYSHTVTQIWVPQGSAAVGKEYDPATHIAVPGNTSRQRLVQSGRVHES